jgi:hypothetical protein
MAVFQLYPVTCTCGHTFEARLARSVNGGRSKALRDAILDGKLHRVRCPGCEHEFSVEKAFSYADFKTNTFFDVRPRWERHLYRRASKQFTSALQRLPSALSPVESRKARVVFGLQELREKLVIQDAGVDDRVIEVVKLYLLHEHPFLLHKPRLRLVLHRLHAGAYEFIASHDHAAGKFRLRVPEPVVLDFMSRRQEWERLLEERHSSSPFKETAPWTNLWRYSPQISALADLRQYADTLRMGGTVDFDSKGFQRMLRRLPRGAHLPSEAKQELQVVFDEAVALGRSDVQEQLFEVRYGLDLEDGDWQRNANNEDIDVLWDVLKQLPPGNVEGSTTLNQFLLDNGRGGGWYDPNTYDVGIGERMLADRDLFEDVVRHEVGHAVHEQHAQRVDAWLHERFGWQRFGKSDADIDAWVRLMGGWGPLEEAEQSQVRDVLREAMGDGGVWDAVRLEPRPEGHPWRREDLAARQAYERSDSNWYLHHPTWYRANGKAFFVNFYYSELMVVDEATSKFISRVMPSPYAAMSPLEFFAELYALYHDPRDPRRQLLPDDVSQWLADNVGASRTGTPLAA